tara:strand:- start:907 stop:1026 length:120 start_codon:yes stop_codon:yes gene_type:complete
MITAAPTARFCCEVLLEEFPAPKPPGSALLLSIFSIYPN